MAFAAATPDIGRYEEALVFKQTIEAPAIGNRGYTNDVHADRRKKIQPAQAGFVCVDAVSTAGFLQPAQAGFVCVDAVSTAGFLFCIFRRSLLIYIFCSFYRCLSHNILPENAGTETRNRKW